MGQKAILFSSFRGPGHATTIGAAAVQGAVIAQILGRTGANWYVNETTGNDTQVRAGFPFSPFKTLAAAQLAASPGDTIFITGTVHTTATILLGKDNITYVGLNAPSSNGRARISSQGTTFFTPLVNVTGQGCRFEGIGTFYGFVDALASVCWAEAGGRNFYKNMLFGGGGNATGAAQAGCRSLTINGNGENWFEDCTYGLSSVARATNANATMEFLGQSQRNRFTRSVFQMYSSLAGNVHIKATTGTLGGGDQYFFDTIFSNAVDAGATSIDADTSVTVDANGALIFGGTITSVGSGKIAAAGPVYTTGVVPTAGTSGLAVKST